MRPARVHRSAAVGIALAGVAVGLAACGSSPSAIGPGSYVHKGRAAVAPHRSQANPPQANVPTSSTTAPTTVPVTTPVTGTTEPSYLHPPPGQPWLVRGSAPWVAAQYVTAQTTESWQWSTPARYLYNSKPYMTSAFYRQADYYEQKALRAMGTSGSDAYWHQQKERKDGSYGVVEYAYTITEAGVTPTSEVVRLAYWLGQVVGGVTEPVNTNDVATIEDLLLHKVAGRWLVAAVQPDEAG